MAAANWKNYTKDQKFIFFDEGKEKNSEESFYFIQGADIQFGLTVNYPTNRTPYKNDWSSEIVLAEKAVECINGLNPRPRFFVMCGDLCDAFPVSEPQESRIKQEEDFKRIFSKIHPDIPLVCVCGNHDVENQPSREAVAKYRSSFGDDYFSYWVGGTLFIVLNSQYYFDSTLVPDIFSKQEAWLDSVLAEGKQLDARIVVFQHIPWFVKDADEPDQYFNLPLKVRQDCLQKFHDAGVTHVFCGHLHHNSEGVYKSVQVVTTSAIGLQLGKDVSGLRIVKVTKDSLEHVYHPLDSFPTTIQI